MAEITLVIGSHASWTDGRGEVRSVVIDKKTRAVTHLVVEPIGRGGLAKFVPLALMDATMGEIRLRCTEAEFQNLSDADETVALDLPSDYGDVQLLPPGWRSAGDLPVVDGSTLRSANATTIDRAPPEGEMEERRGDHVHATDGDIGQVQALRIDPRAHYVTHVLLKEGHLWGRKEVAIPIAKVAGFDNGIQLNITKRQVGDLTPVDIDHPDG